MAQNTKLVLLQQAAQHLGRHELASRLSVPESLLDAWLLGHATMPDRKFLLLGDLLDEISGPKLSE